MPAFEFRQAAILPARPRPIVSIGLGGIVHDAHYPAYRLAGFDVVGGFDIDGERAAMMADKFGIPRLYGSLSEAIQGAPADAVFDIAVPGGAIADILREIPARPRRAHPEADGRRPGRSARDSGHLPRTRAGRRDQLPVAFRPLHHRRPRHDRAGFAIGELYDLEFRVQCNTPWHLWPFLFPLPRCEILYHSIHYVDLDPLILWQSAERLRQDDEPSQRRRTCAAAPAPWSSWIMGRIRAST